MRIVFLVLGMVLIGTPSLFSQSFAAEKKVLKLMGCRFEVSAIADNDTLAWAAINVGIQEMQRIERLISSWDKNSQTSAINQNAGITPVKVDRELFHLIYRAKKISTLTQGAFDISYASMDRIWKFDGSMTEKPTQATIDKARQHINWQDIILDATQSTVFLKEKGMKIGFGAIGKGYAANRAKALMSKLQGVHGGVVNASGDLISWGTSPKSEGWTITIADPKDITKGLGYLSVQDMAVVTSGNYEKYIKFDGVRYAHIIDPRTGYPTTGVKSVTIVCPDAEVADALATSVFVLGQEKGLALINKLNHIECLIITDEDEILTSNNLKLNHF